MDSTKVRVAIILAIFVCCFHIAQAEVIEYRTCDKNDCDIHEVRVIPCEEALNHAPCKVHRRRASYDISYDFTPQFDADTLEQKVVWVKSETVELPLLALDKDGCKGVTCPLKSGVRSTYKMQIPVDAKFPTKSYKVKWTLSAANGTQCCFMHNIKVVN